MSDSVKLCKVCHASASSKCSGCHSVFYCGAEHQMEDRSNHRDWCQAYEEKTSADLGTYLVAARDIKVGDVILTESPIIVGTHGSFPNPAVRTCNACYRSTDVNALSACYCPDCGLFVCSLKCPGIKDMSRHGSECFLIKTLRTSFLPNTDNIPLNFLLPLRCFILQKRTPKKWKFILELGGFAKKMIDGPAMSEIDNIMIATRLRLLSGVFPKILPDCSGNSLEAMFAVLEAKTFHLRKSEGTFLRGFFPKACMLTSSCMPNTRLCFEEPIGANNISSQNDWRPRLSVRAVKNIQRGEVLSTAYLDIMKGNLIRRLSAGRFRCSCDRCLDPRELGTNFGTLKCAECAGWILPVNAAKIETSVWKCIGSCRKSFPFHEVIPLHTSMMEEIEAQFSVIDIPKDGKEKILENFEAFLHPRHHFILLQKVSLLVSYEVTLNKLGSIARVSDADLERISVLGEDVQFALDQIDPSLAYTVHMFGSKIINLVQAKLEITKRKLTRREWDTTVAVSTIMEARRLIHRVINAYDLFEATQPNGVSEIDSDILRWARRKGLNVPVEL